jgi:tetratricopeptide (TPR) repeat protein
MITLITSLLSIGLQMTPDAYQLNSQGRELLEHRRYSAAVEVFRRAVDRAESDFGPSDPATAMIRRNLALAYIQTRALEAGEKVAKLALSAMESRFGPADPGITPILNVLAECYASAGRIDEAERASERAVAIGPSAGVHFGIALHNLGALREFSGDADGAASFYRRAIVVKTETLGAAHPDVLLSRRALRRVENRQHTAAQTSIKLTRTDE